MMLPHVINSPTPAGAPIWLYANIIQDPDTAFVRLQSELEWERRDGAPRSEYYCNDTDVPYTYGHKDYARTYEPRPYVSTITAIRAEVERYAGYLCEKNINLDVCFLNRYHDQSDQLGWHSDDSPEMDDDSPIGIVSLGVEREICFKKIGAPNSEQIKIKLPHGSLCIMMPGMQDTHQHRIPKAGFQCGERISLTFRHYVKV